MSLVQTLNGIAFGSLLMLLASGLALIYGLRGVMNFAHGALYMLGAYAAYEVVGRANFWLALIFVPLLLAIVGAVLEVAVFRPLSDRPIMEVALVTFGLLFVIEFVIVTIWGRAPKSVAAPNLLAGSVQMFGVKYPTFRLVLIAIALTASILLVVWLKSSRVGLHIRAAVHDRQTAEIMGVNVRRVSLIVVCLGSALAGLAGTLAAPYLSIHPTIGHDVLLLTLIVVVIGGLGSIFGAMFAAMILGAITVTGIVGFPYLAPLIPYVALMMVMIWRPTGIAGTRIH